MNKKLLNTLCLLSMATIITSCKGDQNSSSNNITSSTSSSSSEVVASTTSTNSNVSSSTSSSTLTSSTSSDSSSSSSSSSSSVDDTSKEEDKYIVDDEKRVLVTLNVSAPETENDVYVIGDFNNWGKFNALNDSSYKVVDGKITISNVEKNVEYSYMYVQKIKGATYTYNFGKDVIDSNENSIIGYTQEGKLISQYCVSQSDEKFTFIASEGYERNDAISGWTQAVYGETIEVEDPNKLTEKPDAGYSLCVSEYNGIAYYLPLENTGTMDGSGRQQYIAYNVELKLNDALSIYDGNNDTGWVEDNLEQYGSYRDFIADPDVGVVCLTPGNYDIYIKLQAGNDAIYIGPAGEEGVSIPSTGYGIKVYPGDGSSEYFVPFTLVDEFEGFMQYFGDNVSLNAGDIFALYDFGNHAEWAEDTLNPAGQSSKFSVDAKGIKCNVTGVYDIYIKLKMNLDEIYIGDQSGQ